MNMQRRFWTPLIVYLFCMMASSVLLAQENLSEIIKKIRPSIVVILTYDKTGKALGQGSGFFVGKEGDIITNYHVLEKADQVEIKTANGTIYSVMRIIGEDREGDLICVSANIPPSVAHPLLISNSLPEVGEHIVVIGSPMGLELTVSDGIVSAVREIPRYGKIIQITAPVSPGSSGSPVINMKAEVIGVATFLIQEGQNLNFAIPGGRLAKIAPSEGQSFSEWKVRKDEEQLKRLYPEGLGFLRAKEYEKALSCYEEAVKIDPNNAFAHFQIGYCNAELGRYQEAVEAYKRAISINANLGEAYRNLGLAYLRLGRYQEAVEAYKRTITINANYAADHLGIGQAYYKLGRYEMAINAYKQGIRINPNDAVAHYDLGLAWSMLGFHEDAQDAYKQAIRINPDFAEALYALGLNYLVLGDRASAIDVYKVLKNLNRDLANELFNVIYR